MIDLSIIIVNYNGEKYLKECLGSVYARTRKSSFEVIFVDNNSTDLSVELVKSKFRQVKIIENRSNLGFCKANNQGIAVSEGKYIVLLNTDTIIEEGALDILVKFMNASPKAGACGPKLLNPDGSPQHQGGLFARRFWLSDKPSKVSYVVGACLLVRREVVDIVGGLDENFFFSNDDLDWCRRIRKTGWDIYFIPQARVIHFGGFTTKKFSVKPFVEGFRGGLYFCKKHYGLLAYLIYRLLLVVAMLLAVAGAGLAYPFLKNKQKLNAFLQILIIAIKGEIYPTYEDSSRQ